MTIRNGLIALLVLLLLGAAAAWVLHRGTIAPATEQHQEAVQSMDKVEDELAARARERLGFSDDFQIAVTQVAYPIGTLIRAGRSIPVSYTACAPAAAALPPAYAAPSLFPNYRLTREAALSFGLDSDALKQIGNAGADVKADSGVSLSFAGIAAQVLADNDLRNLVKAAECRDAIASEPVLMVRGYIVGRRRFTLSASRSAGGTIAVRKVGTMTITPDSGGDQVEVADDAVGPFLQVISHVSLPSGGGTADAPESAALIVARPQTGVRLAGAGRVYVQRDIADSPAKAEAVLAALRAAGLNVVPQVDRIDGAKVPAKAQVRYFNDSDKARAEGAAASLAGLYPGILTVRITLPGPAGQLEVWMPRVGAAPAVSVSPAVRASLYRVPGTAR